MPETKKTMDDYDPTNIISLPTRCRKCGFEISDPLRFCPSCGRPLAQTEKKHYKRPNGAGTVYKMPGRRRRPWIAQKNKMTIGYYATKKEALDVLDQLSGVRITDRFNLTFEQVYSQWSEEHFKGISGSQQRAYRAAFHCFQDLHKCKFRELRASDFQQALDQAPPKSAPKYKQLLTQMANWAVKNEICTTNYAAYAKPPKVEKSEKQTFTQSEIELLVKDDTLPARIALMMIYTGMRIGELFALRVEDCHGTYCVGGEKTDAGRDRIIPIAPPARQYFRDVIADRTAGPLFDFGAAYYRDFVYRPMLERLGIPYKSPHSCRHTFASMMASSGMDPNVLKKIMGHADISTTANIYIHVDDDALIHALDGFTAP